MPDGSLGFNDALDATIKVYIQLTHLRFYILSPVLSFSFLSGVDILVSCYSF